MKSCLTKESTECIVLTIIIVAAFLLKLFINRKVNKIIFVGCLLELPMDIVVLSMGYITSFILNNQERLLLGLVVLFGTFVLAFLIYALCRYSLDYYETVGSSRGSLFLLSGLSHVLAIAVYILSVMFLLGGIQA